MRQRKATAIVLHSGDIFDADRTYLLFTREYGKLRARAKGVRRPKSRLAGNLQPYQACELELVGSEGGWELIVQAHGSNQGYPENPLRFLPYAELIAEMIDKLLPDRERHPELFDGIDHTLQRLRARCGTAEPRELLLITVELALKLLILLGYRPELERCVVTGTPLVPQGLSWSSEVGGVVSEEGLRSMAVPSIPIREAKTVVALRQLARPEFVAERLTMSEAVVREVGRLVMDYLQTQIGKPLKSYVVLDRL
jgi:DNA repair protein RecO (recombination protein O)